MTRSHEFSPDWASAPGDTILDILMEKGFSVSDFAEHLGQPLDDVQALLEGRAVITIAIARQLEHTLGASVEFWMARDYQYREDVTSFHEAESTWLEELPVSDMINFGWLRPTPHPADELKSCLGFFGVTSLSAWHEEYAPVQEAVSFRTSRSFDSRPAAVAAWLRQGEIEAASVDCKQWDGGGFREALSGIRSLTRTKQPDVFVPQLQEQCAKHGVAVVVLRAPAGCRASGATWFVSSDTALIMLSFRHLTDDHFWFTFFHEAGHLLLHDSQRLFLEGTGLGVESEEHEANEFAAEALVPPEAKEEMLRLPLNGREVIRFAQRIGVSPGVVIGQLQHYRRFTHRQLNGLKRRYKWEGFRLSSRGRA